MTDPEKVGSSDELSQRESDLLDALLEYSLGNEAREDDRRVSELMAFVRAGTAPNATVSLAERHVQSSSRSKSWKGWMSVPIAAVLFASILFAVRPASSESQAHAAVERSLKAEQVPKAREYQVKLETRTGSGKVLANDFTLYVMQRRFAIRTSSLLGSGDVWMGGSGDKRWIVPRFGPVVVGQKGLLPHLSRQRQVIETPFLKLSVILERMQSAYDLQLQSSALITDERTGEEFSCQHIVGVRKKHVAKRFPQTVQLWADDDSGFARRIELIFDRPDGESGLLTATARLVAMPELEPDFFGHSDHHAVGRRIVDYTEVDEPAGQEAGE